MKTENDLVTLLANAAMNAAAGIAARRGIARTIDAGRLCEELRNEMKARFDGIAKGALEAHDTLGAEWARKALNIGANEIAIAAIDAAVA